MIILRKILDRKIILKFLSIGFILILAIAIGVKSKIELAREEWISDFDYVCEIIETTSLQLNNYDAFYGTNFKNNKNNCRQKILSCKNDFEFYCILKKFLNNIPSIHTTVQFPEIQLHGYNDEELLQQSEFINKSSAHWEYELKNNVQKYSDAKFFLFYYVDGNYYLYETDGSLFCITEINDIPSDLYITDKSTGCKLMFDNINRKSFKPLMIFNDKYGEKIRINGIDENERPVSKNLFYSEYSEISWYYLNPSVTDEYIDNIKIYKDINTSTAYLEIRSLKNISDSEKQKNNIHSALEMENIIIDLRYCSGGSTDYFFDNILSLLITDNLTVNDSFEFPLNEHTAYFKKKYSDYVTLNTDKMTGYYSRDYSICSMSDRKHKIYVLVNSGTMSAADQAAYIFKKYKIGTLIGENTGGEGRTGSYMSAVLPSSGLILTYNIGMCDDADIFGTSPDIYVNCGVGSYLKKMKINKCCDAESYENRLKWDNVLIETLELMKEKENVK